MQRTEAISEFNSSQTSLTEVMIDPRDLKPSPENNKVYKPVDPKDPAIIELARSISVIGLREPLVVTKDGYILSGHRRREAAIIAGLSTVPCRIESITHDDPGFVNLLISYNQQRIKNRGEQLREAVIKTNPDEAYEQLLAYREQKIVIGPETIKVDHKNPRKKISAIKSEMVTAVKTIINDHRRFWPLSDRQIHYRLLNDPPLRNTKNRKSRYKNDRASYQDLCDLLTRLRLNGTIPMNVIDDPTRPTSNWYVHRNPQEFAKRELDGFLKGYRRDLQQSQLLHFEVVAEKMTVQSIIEPVCGKYNIPFTIGRGYSSIPPRWEIVQRFKRSGKQRLLLLVLGDFDPEGVNIGESLLQSLREDFDEEQTEAIRVGLNLEHIERFKLHDNLTEAKSSSARYKGFVERYGRRVYELEALQPEQLQLILYEAIDSVLDVGLFNAELKAERCDAAYLQRFREGLQLTALDVFDFLDDGEENL